MLPASIAKRTYIFTTSLITMLMLYFTYDVLSTVREQVIKEKQRDLLTIASLLDQQVPPDTDDLLRDESIRKLNHKEKLALFNPQLQPVLAKYGKIYSKYGMGYGIDDRRLALYPPKPEIMEGPFAKAGQRAIQRGRETKQIQYFSNSQNTLWGQSTLSILYPHIVNDEMIWFIWVNIKMDNLDQAYTSALWRSVGVFFLIWLGVMVVLRYLFNRLRNSLKNLATQVVERDDNTQRLTGFPELELLLHAVITMRETLATEYEEKARLNNQIRQQAQLLDEAHDAIIVRDLENRIIYWNGGAESCYGWTKKEATHCVIHDILQTEFPEPLERITAALEAFGHWEGELIHRGKSGAKIIVMSHWTLCRNDQGVPSSIMQINYDITKQKQSEELFFKAFSCNPIMMGIVAIRNWVIMDVNKSYEDIVGLPREEIIGKTPEEIGLYTNKEQLEALRKTAVDQGGRVRNYEIEICTKRGDRRMLFSCELVKIAEEICLLGMYNDITELKNYERELAHFDRLNVIGEMAAGIGHEVRNPMTTIRGYLQLFQGKQEFVSYRDDIAMMIAELDRANGIITRFLSLSKDKTVEMKKGNLNDTIQFIHPLLQADAFCQGHQLHLALGNIPDIEFDDNEIRQMILNLVRNGLEAMDREGIVTVSTSDHNDEIYLSISDTGPGIPPEILAKIGTPFMTTKEQGTGLGLPVCYRIAMHHGARIEVDTSEQGTTFVVCFSHGP